MSSPSIDAPTVRSNRPVAVLGLVWAAAMLVIACRKEPPPAGDPVESPVTDAGELAPEPPDASRASRDLETRVSGRDGGALHPACEGKSLTLFAAALDARCSASETDHALLVAGREKVDGGSPTIKQEARVEGGRLVFALVNASKTAQTIPVRVSLSQGGAFSVLADDGRGFVYELASPKLDADVARATETLLKRTLHDRLRTGSGHDLPSTGEEAGPPSRVHTAAIRLLPAGRATVRMTVDPTSVARLGPKGPLPPCAADGDGATATGDASTCVLPKGHYTLYIGQLLSEIEAGPPARAEWDAP